jgi:energy-coupling factor transport system permease protein
VSAAPAAVLLAALAVTALLATEIWPVAVICMILLLVALRAPKERRRPYLIGTLMTAFLFVVITPFVEVIGTNVLWSGPTIPVLGTLDVTTEELRNGLFQGLRLAAVGLAFAD